MKLAEALQERADLNRNIEQLNHSLAVGPIDSRNQIGQARNGSIQLLF